ncbi:pro-resilin-like [Orussus abietinus]|uniref:pro-resilin-like n=1 Tax=Orussus abietinus TaxID=222816 RepID=UPI000626744F|nr:pro-resilin-like [Orussus abietinus]
MDTAVRQIILAMALSMATVFCEPPLSNQYGVPENFVGGNSHGNHGGVTNSYGSPLGGGHDLNQDYIDSQPKSYEFGYAVKDAASGNDFGRRETSDGDTVRGEYRVQLPDGRTQIVSYTADWRTGFHADVRYEGEASYPEQYNANGNNGYNNNNNGGRSYDFNGNAIDVGYNGAGNQGGYNNYQGNGANYNTGYNQNYQFGSNSLDNGYKNYGGYSGNSYGSNDPSPTYGTPTFH